MEIIKTVDGQDVTVGIRGRLDTVTAPQLEQFIAENIEIGGIFQDQVGLFAAGGYIDDVHFLDQLSVDLTGPGFCISHSAPPEIFYYHSMGKMKSKIRKLHKIFEKLKKG